MKKPFVKFKMCNEAESYWRMKAHGVACEGTFDAYHFVIVVGRNA